MNDDFNTAVALAHINEELRRLNKTMTDLQKKGGDWAGFDTATETLKYACQLVGILYHEPKNYKNRVLETKKETLGLDVNQIEALIAQRKAARETKGLGQGGRMPRRVDRHGRGAGGQRRGNRLESKMRTNEQSFTDHYLKFTQLYTRTGVEEESEERIPEKIIRCVWNDQLIKTEKLKTTDGGALEIIFPGCILPISWNV